MAYGQFTRKVQNRTVNTNLKTSSSTKSKEKKETKSILSFFKAPVEQKQRGTKIATRQLDSGKHLISTTKTSTGQRPAGTIISKKEENRFISAGSSRTMQGGEAGPRGTRFVNAGKNFTDFMAKPSVVKSGPPVKNTLVKKPVVQNIVKSGPPSKNTRVNNTKTTTTSVKRNIEDPILLRTRKAVGGDESLILNQRKFLQSKSDGSIRKDKPSLTARSLITLNKIKEGLKKGKLGHGIKNKYPVNYPSTRLPKVQDLTGIGPKNFNKKPTKKTSLMSNIIASAKSTVSNAFSNVDSSPWLSKARRTTSETAKQERARVSLKGSLNEGQWGTIKSLGKAKSKVTPVSNKFVKPFPTTKKISPIFNKTVKTFPFTPVYTNKIFPPKAQYYSTVRASQGRKWWLGRKKEIALIPTEVR